LNNIRFIYILFFILCLGCNKNKKHISDTTSDSLDIYIENAKDPSLTLEASSRNNDRALEIVLQKQNDSAARVNLFRISYNSSSTQKYNKFKKTNDIILELSIEGKDTLSIAKAYKYNAEYYKAINKIDSAFILLLKCEKLYTKLNDKINRGKILFKKGTAQYDVGDILSAELSMSQAYSLVKNSDEKQFVYEVLSMSGIIANALEDYNQAIEYHNKALALSQEYELNTLNQTATTLNNLGGVYQNLNDNKEAIKKFNQALNNKSDLKNARDLYARLLDNLAYSKLKIKDYNQLPGLFFQALKIRDSLNLKSSIILSNIHISEYYAEKGDTLQSQKYSAEALNLARNINSPIDILISLKQTATVDHKRAPSYSKEYIKINDSLQQAERKSRDKFTKIQLETEEIISENDKLEQKNRSLLYFFVGTLMIGMLLFVIRTQRARNRELLLKQAQQKANEDIYNLMISQQNNIEESRIKEKKRIAQELHDGVLGRLFGARLNLDSLNKTNTEDAAKKRNEYLAELKNIEQDIREISHDLNREKYVLINNFIAILNNLLEEQRTSFEPEVVVSIDDNIKWELLENTAKINLYRIIQESLQNINKYANATTIKIEIKKSSDSLILNVTDNGIGFAVTTKKKGIGLQNMISRTHEIEGTFDVRSKKGKGTTITVTFPISDKQPAEA
jgi:signal transduction histidine kinase